MHCLNALIVAACILICRAEGWTHLAEDVKPTILLTEEPMKADVIHALTGSYLGILPAKAATVKERDGAFGFVLFCV